VGANLNLNAAGLSAIAPGFASNSLTEVGENIGFTLIIVSEEVGARGRVKVLEEGGRLYT
jgi:hypothetical protein